MQRDDMESIGTDGAWPPPAFETRSGALKASRWPDEGLTVVKQALSILRVDFPPLPRRPQRSWLVIALGVSVIGSLAADAILVAIGTALFPGTNGYVHFRFSDYGKLTVVGVVLACVAWPMVAWISSTPRWLFLRLAVVVTGVLLLPDIWILMKGQPAKAVLVLVAMHLVIALVTYNALVHLAPATQRFRRVADTVAP